MRVANSQAFLTCIAYTDEKKYTQKLRRKEKNIFCVITRINKNKPIGHKTFFIFFFNYFKHIFVRPYALYFFLTYVIQYIIYNCYRFICVIFYLSLYFSFAYSIKLFGTSIGRCKSCVGAKNVALLACFE